MRPRSQPKKELCAVCGGGLRKTAITHEERRGEQLYLFHNVPAQVCTACGEIADVDQRGEMPRPTVGGFRVIDYSVSFTGFCRDCRR